MPLQATSGVASYDAYGSAAAGQKVYIEDVHSTYLYTGNGGTQDITNGIPLAGTAEWSAYKLQDIGGDGRAIAVDTSGNFYTTGFAADGSRTGIVLAKYNSAGSLQWQRKLYQSTSYGYGVAVDSSSNVYVTGAVFDLGSGQDYLIVAKYNSSGTIQWQRKLQQNNSVGFGIAVDSSANVYVTGTANDGANNYLIVAKYNTSGTIQWQRKLQNTTTRGYGVTTDSSGNVYVTGATEDPTQYILIAKYNTSGTLQWQRRLRENSSTGLGIAVDSSGNVYVTGYPNDGTNNYIITAKYNSSGSLQWQRKLQEQAGNIGYAITVDASGNSYVAGRGYDGAYYMLVAAYNTSGTLQWQRKLRQSGEAFGYGVAIDTSGGLYVAGRANDGSNNYIVSLKLKQDGTTERGTALVTMQPGTATESAAGASDSAGTATDSAGTATESAAGATDAAGTATATSATQAAVTGKGGLVWIKERNSTGFHRLLDTLRGVNRPLFSNATNASPTQTELQTFNSDGFTVTGANTNNTFNYASWTWAKQPKFFDVVTYTGTGSARTVSHSLGAVPGCIIVKATNSAVGWAVYHRSLGNGKFLRLDLTQPESTSSAYWNNTDPTSTQFTVGTDPRVNDSGITYVAYLFAHDAGGFGDSGTDNVISCGSYTGSGSDVTVTLGYEPQFVLIKNTTTSANWQMLDIMRGMPLAGSAAILAPNLSDAESSLTAPVVSPTATGMVIAGGVGTSINASGSTYIYIAIRRGPMRKPTSGTSVYSPDTSSGATGTAITTNFPVDLQVVHYRSGVDNVYWMDRLRGVNSPGLSNSTPFLLSDNTNAETTSTTASRSWDNVGFQVPGLFSGASYIYWNLRRAPGFFDVVCYQYSSSSPAQTHNLAVTPELIIFKCRDAVQQWYAYHKDVGVNDYLTPNTTAAKAVSTGWITTPSATSFTAYLSEPQKYVAYLFATCPGVSKVGSYTGTGATLQIDCGFAAGARFVLIKRTDSTGDWYVWDSARGIVAGNDPYLLLNSTAAEVTTTDWVDTYSLGFELSNAGGNNANINTASYIYLAIA
jgi:hypothetical protein